MKIEVCTGKTCKSKFSEYIKVRLENDMKKFEIEGDIEFSPCMGNCKKWPNVSFNGKREEYMNPAKASKIFLNNVKKK